MELIDWIKFGLALLLVAIGLIVLAAWAVFHAMNIEDDWR